MEEEKMKQNSVQAPNCEPVGAVASTTMRKAMFMEYAELSLEKPTSEAFPLDSTESLFSLISTTVSAISWFISVILVLLVFALRLLTFSLSATFNWLTITMEKLNGNGKGKETRQSTSMVRRNEETKNPNQHGNYKEDQRFDSSTINGCETTNSVHHGYAIDTSFNNYGSGKQDYSYCEVNSSTSKDSYNNHASGLQALSGANIFTSSNESVFNNMSIHAQSFRDAKIGSSNNPKAIRRAFNNGENGTQIYNGYRNSLE